MADLTFQIEGAEAVPYAASPLLYLKTRIACVNSDLEIQNILLQCQIQIEPARRPYVADEQSNLRELFGAPARWSHTLRPILWANSQLVVPPFQGSTVVNVPIPCTFDFNVASTKYFHGLESGEIPICILFSGTIFYAQADGSLQVAKIPWSQEVNYRLPVSIWKEMIEMYYPNTAWLCLQRDVFDKLHRYKLDRGILTWDQTLESLLAGAEETTMRKLGT
jgi:hypothetical protein